MVLPSLPASGSFSHRLLMTDLKSPLGDAKLYDTGLGQLNAGVLKTRQKDGTETDIDTSPILRPEISGDGSFLKYQKIVGDELAWYVADLGNSTISKLEVVDEKQEQARSDSTLVEADFSRGG